MGNSLNNNKAGSLTNIPLESRDQDVVVFLQVYKLTIIINF
jgi:hypothetical protein